MEIWRKKYKFGNLENVWKFENSEIWGGGNWKFGEKFEKLKKLQSWEKNWEKFGKKSSGKNWKYVKTWEIWKNIWKFGQISKSGRKIENLEIIWNFGKYLEI